MPHLTKLETVLWFLVACVWGNLLTTSYTRYVVPPSVPVKHERKHEIRKAADEPDEQQMAAMLLLYLLMQMGAVEIEVAPAQPPPMIEDGPAEPTSISI